MGVEVHHDVVTEEELGETLLHLEGIGLPEGQDALVLEDGLEGGQGGEEALLLGCFGDGLYLEDELESLEGGGEGEGEDGGGGGGE